MQFSYSLKHRQFMRSAEIKDKLIELVPAFYIGNVAVRNRVLLAPMAGITDAPFRRLVSQLGAGLVVSEMTAGEALVAGRRNAMLRAEGQGTGTHVVQLAGCEPRWMAEGARIAEGSGAEVIDINMGCPAGAGCGRAHGDGACANAMPVLHRRGELGLGACGQRSYLGPARDQWRH